MIYYLNKIKFINYLIYLFIAAGTAPEEQNWNAGQKTE